MTSDKDIYVVLNAVIFPKGNFYLGRVRERSCHSSAWLGYRVVESLVIFYNRQCLSIFYMNEMDAQIQGVCVASERQREGFLVLC